MNTNVRDRVGNISLTYNVRKILARPAHRRRERLNRAIELRNHRPKQYGKSP